MQAESAPSYQQANELSVAQNHMLPSYMQRGADSVPACALLTPPPVPAMVLGAVAAPKSNFKKNVFKHFPQRRCAEEKCLHAPLIGMCPRACLSRAKSIFVQVDCYKFPATFLYKVQKTVNPFPLQIFMVFLLSFILLPFLLPNQAWQSLFLVTKLKSK